MNLFESEKKIKVFVRDYGNGSDPNDGPSSMGGKEFKAMAEKYSAEFDYAADKGLGFEFEHSHQADGFVRDCNARFRDLSAEREDAYD